MLGLIHRTVLGAGPSHFKQFFKRDANAPHARHRFALAEWQGDESDFELPGSSPAQYISRSALGLCKVYNLLPARFVESAPTVKLFQKQLQDLLKSYAGHGFTNWEMLFSPRANDASHPLADIT